MKRSLGTILTILYILIFLGPEAHAENFLAYSSAEVDSYPPYVFDPQKVRSFEVGLSADDRDKVIFNASFYFGLTPSSMATVGTQKPLMRIKIFYSSNPSSSQNFQLSIDAPTTPYQGETRINAITNNSCGAKTWMPKDTNSIAFEISRNCIGLPDRFFASLFVDANINQDNPDSYFIPQTDPLPLDYSKFPKPIPKSNQVLSGFTSQQSYTLDVGTINFNTSTNSGIPITVLGKTPEICRVTSQNTISLIDVGICVVSLNAPGNNLWNAAAEASFTFNIIPKKIIKADQNLYFNRPATLYENTGEYRLDIYTDTRLEVKVVSSTPDVCLFPYSGTDSTIVKIYRAGTCAFSVSQAGNDRYNPSQGSTSIEIYAVAKPAPSKTGVKPAPAQNPQKPKTPEGLQILSGSSSTSGGSKAGASAANGGNVLKFGEKKIICVKGSQSKEVTGKNPKCPTGYKEKK